MAFDSTLSCGPSPLMCCLREMIPEMIVFHPGTLRRHMGVWPVRIGLAVHDTCAIVGHVALDWLAERRSSCLCKP
jgi:hypothetical protein